LQILPVHIEKEITPDDNLSKIIINSTDIDDGDILVIAQKVISKQEGRIVELSSVNRLYYLKELVLNITRILVLLN